MMNEMGGFMQGIEGLVWESRIALKTNGSFNKKNMRILLLLIFITNSNVFAQQLYVTSTPTISNQANKYTISVSIRQWAGDNLYCQFGIFYRKRNTTTWNLGKPASKIYTFLRNQNQIITISDFGIDGPSGEYEFKLFYSNDAKKITQDVVPFTPGSQTSFPHPFILSISSTAFSQQLDDLLVKIEDVLSKLKFSTSTYLFLFNSIDEVEKQLDIEKIKDVQSAVGKAQSILDLVTSVQQILASEDPVKSYFLCIKLLAGNTLLKPYSSLFASYAELGIAFKDAIDRIIYNYGPLYFEAVPSAYSIVIKFRSWRYYGGSSIFYKKNEIEKFVRSYSLIGVKADKKLHDGPLPLYLSDKNFRDDEIVYDLFSTFENVGVPLKLFLKIEFTNKDIYENVVDGQQLIIPLEPGFVTINPFNKEVRVGIDVRGKTEKDLQTDRKKITLFKF